MWKHFNIKLQFFETHIFKALFKLRKDIPEQHIVLIDFPKKGKNKIIF